ncbi:sugar ABC transporter permease [Microbacterium betulae]|uniref:Sugar ABC transporter permease n=1 Tax=Microbacterium betulae TaxID=2981139 RepID=A0AA97FJ67_9MICO|nr:sugar ABC transporter permease [Microbacterium sp. AB]WOF24025.1 sugar ABC transporter permease [Microbacterium sp. AB]
MGSSDIVTAVTGVVAVPAAVVLWLVIAERIVTAVPHRRQESVRAWLWLALPVVLAGGILLYPLIQTFAMSFQGPDGTGFVGLQNYAWVFSEGVLPVLLNNLAWLVLLPATTLLLGLALAALADGVRYEWLIRTVMLLPMAISFAAAAVIWRLMYAYQPSGADQLGTLNAVLDLLGADTVAFLSDPTIATFSLIAVGIWMSTGLAMVMLSSAIKNVDSSTLEAAQLDGTGPFGAFWHVTLPQIAPTVSVVYTTQVIFSLKVFDIVYTMTNGAFNTDVIANRMYSELFRAREYGHAAAIAIVLLLAAVPVIVANVRQFRAER